MRFRYSEPRKKHANMPVAARPRTALELVKPPNRRIRNGMIGFAIRIWRITKRMRRPTAVPARPSVCMRRFATVACVLPDSHSRATAMVDSTVQSKRRRSP